LTSSSSPSPVEVACSSLTEGTVDSGPTCGGSFSSGGRSSLSVSWLSDPKGPPGSVGTVVPSSLSIGTVAPSSPSVATTLLSLSEGGRGKLMYSTISSYSGLESKL